MNTLLLLTLLSGVAHADSDWSPDGPYWQVRGRAGATRWVIVRDWQKHERDGPYHVEVLERQEGAKAYQFTRLAAHMAISTQALKASVVRRLRNSSLWDVYPEHYDYAFQQWQKANGSEQKICVTSVSECLP